MENKDTNIDYQKFVRVVRQKWGIVEIPIGIILFLLEIRIHDFLYREFSSPIFFSSSIFLPSRNVNIKNYNIKISKT